MSGHTKQQGNGNGTRYDVGSGDWLDNERNKARGPGVYLSFGKRFCETCQQVKPKGIRKAVKGWKCDECLKAPNNI